MKKIIIFYASFGGGHLSAAKSLEAFITTHYKNVKVELIDCIKYVNKTIEKVSTTTYLEIAKNLPWAWGKIYFDSQNGALAHISSRANTFMAIKLSKLLKQKQPDLIICTHPFGSQMCSYLKRKGRIKTDVATIITDFKSHIQWLVGNEYINYYFVSNETVKNELIAQDINPSKIYVTGIPISERFKQNFDKEKILNELGFSKDKKTILFFGGGKLGIGKTKTLEFFKSIITSSVNLQIIAVSGQNESMNVAFHKIVSENNKENSVKIFEFTDRIPEFMSISDLIISKPGGLTTSEALASNIPIIAINPIPGQEEENATFIENNNVGYWIKKQDNIIPILTNLLDNKHRLTLMQKNTKKIAKIDSTKDICEFLLQHICK